MEAGKVIIRKITPEDASEEYVSWLNDEEVTAGIETSGQTHTLNSVKEYVNEVIKATDVVFFAITDKETGKHIGNVKLYDLNQKNKTCAIGIMIGDKNYWGKGYGADTFRAAIKYTFDVLKFQKLWFVTFKENEGQIKLYKRLGFKIEGLLERQVFKNGRFHDQYFMALFSDQERK